MLNIYQSNKIEGLLGQLVKLLLQANTSPLQQKAIVVENPGLAHWLKMQLAQTLGIAANIQFPMPSRFFWQLQRDLVSDELGEWQTESIFNKDPLTWFIFDVLRDETVLQRAGFELLLEYVRDTEDEDQRLFQLSGRIADMYDQYLVYRPDWIKNWEHNDLSIDGESLGESRWQAELWQMLREEAKTRQFPLHHRASLTEDFLALLDQTDNRGKLPSDIIFFGFSTLPKSHIESLELLSKHCEVHLLTPNPSQSYWGDVLDERLQARLRLKGKALPLAQSGNALLASLGRMGQEYQRMLLEIDDSQEYDLFIDTEQTDLLSQIQHQILTLQESSSNPQAVNADDKSIQLVGCHSAMREVEVLHDHLLDVLQQDDIEPEDIVVMIPDVASYAPYIDAVFQTGVENSTGQAVRIPYSISDRPIQEEHPLIHGFLQLLSLPKGRLAYSEVIALLEIPAVYQRFGLNESQLSQVKQWIELSAVRWGYDDNHRMKQGLPKWQQNTWLYGFQRLLMGYAYSERFSESQELPFDIAPVENVEGLEAAVLGPIMAFVNDLYAFILATEESKTCPEWRYFLQDSLQHFFAVNADEQAIQEQIHQVLESWLETSQQVNFSSSIPFSVVYQGIQQGLQKNGGSQHFMIGRVNFCTLLPMRSIPFKQVAVLGLNDQEYPRTVPGNSLDLMRFNRRPGDRNRRDEDRYLFLEAILSARQGLWLSYKSLDQKQNTELTPSVVLAEFMDYLDSNFYLDGRKISQHLFQQHPLQPFNQQYFIGDGLIHSYQQSWFHAINPSQTQTQMESDDYSDGDRKYENIQLTSEVSLQMLIEFFQLPAKAFLNQKLNVYFYHLQDVHEDDEPFELAGLEKHAVRQYLLEKTIERKAVNSKRLQPWLPYGKIGDRQWQDTEESVKAVLASARDLLTADKQQPIEINLTCNTMSHQTVKLVGWVNDVFSARFVKLEVARFKAKYLIELIIQHAVLNAQGYDYFASLVCQDLRVNLRPMSAGDAKSYLANLLNYFQNYQEQPLEFMPETGWILHDPSAKAGSREKNAEKRFFEVNERSFLDPECLDPHYARCFDVQDTIPDNLIAVAHTLFSPWLDNELLEVVK